MSSETELKLSVPPSAVNKVARLAWLRKMATGPLKREKIETVYFDTPKRRLHDRGLALRVRRAGQQYLQSIKADGIGSNGPFERGEWEHEIAGAAPDLKLAKGTPLETLARKKLKRKLEPVFETVIERTTLPIRLNRTDLKLAVDRGHIKARRMRQREPISEIEIEAEGGDSRELSRVAQRLAHSIAVAYGARSKAERGFALSSKRVDAPVKGAPLLLEPSLTAGGAFRAIGFSCLTHAVANERAVRRGDAEGVHQMRVGLRRLRAVTSVFKEMLRGPEPKAIKRELKWLTEQLSPARDLDVLIAGQVHPLRDGSPVDEDAGVLEQDLNAQRRAGIEKAKAAMASDRYRAIGLQVALWLAYGKWSRSLAASVKSRREMRVRELAEEIIAKRATKILKKIRRVEQLDARGRHKLRIAVKKLRYACEFFATVFRGDKRDARRRRFCKALKKLQGYLGSLSDIEVHKRLAHAIARNGGHNASRSREALAMGFITGREDKQVSSCLAGIEKTAGQLAKLTSFWG
ncbi:MAG: CHAD domain-containing protein [Steroidobacteraceae bacterium]